MSWIEPIVDRTQSDVDRLIQLSIKINSLGWANVSPEDRVEWLIGSDGNIKGAINDSDLNRMECNTKFLVDKLRTEFGITIDIDESNPLWNKTIIPLLSNINRIRDNVVATVGGSYPITGTPTIEYNNPLNWDDANDIERNLYDLYNTLLGIELIWRYSGTFESGDDSGIL